MLRMLVACVIVLFGAVQATAQVCRQDVVTVKTDRAEIQFNVELATTPETRARGLMYREQLPRRSGMLFVYEAPQPAAFWMKNTLIPLDMIFTDRSGQVSRVHENAVPGDLTPIDGGAEVFAVLEVNAGLAETYGIAPGSLLRHPAFTGGPAAWPC